MKVLYMVPWGKRPAEITPFTFLDEEIQALSAAGVDAYVLSGAVNRDETRNGIHMVALTAGSWSERLKAVRLVHRHRALLQGGYTDWYKQGLHAVRVEGFVARIVRERDIDIIHSHFGAMVGMGGALARSATSTPLIATFRGMDLLVARDIEYGLRRDDNYDHAVKSLLRNADFTTFASDFMREEAISLGARPATAITIRKGVDLNHFNVVDERQALQRDLGVSRGPMLLTVAGLIPRKGIDVLIRAMARLPEDLRPTLVVCGRGPERAKLAGLSERLGVGDRVCFRGRVSRATIPRYFAACDVFVLPSRLEAAGNVLLEAMASGRPVITTRSGGPPEYVHDGETGFVVEPGDEEALRQGLERLLRDHDLRERMGRQGRQRARVNHQYRSLIQGYQDLYRQVVGQGETASEA